MSDAVRQARCAEVAAAVMELIPCLLEGKADPAKLAAASASVARVRAVLDAGADGITHEAYLHWLRVAPPNIAALEQAIARGDADAAFAAFRDPDRGLHLLASGCEGCVGW